MRRVPSRSVDPGIQKSGESACPLASWAPRLDPEVGLSDLVRSPALASPYWSVKHALDRVAAAVLLVVLSPLLFGLSLLVMADVGHTFIFRQVRPGRLGRPFTLYKFRTMRDACDETGRRIPDARRSSAAGRLLRESRLDELPQLFNILFGEMSFVGPRPLLPADQAPEHAARLAVRPGLTGWAQVNGGRDASTAEKAAMDVWYILNASFRLDAEIAWRTVKFLVRGERASIGHRSARSRQVRAMRTTMLGSRVMPVP